MKHIDERRLLEFAQDQVNLTTEETEHLKQCEYCRELLRVFVRQNIRDIRAGQLPNRVN